MDRRSFLSKVIRRSGLFVFSLLPFGFVKILSPKLHQQDKRHVPLPGALEDIAAFDAACIGCGLCGEVCPPRCVLFHKREGGSSVNTPYINPEVKACTLCGLCMEVCPTNALTVTPIREVKMGIAQIDRIACYPWVDRGICGACVSICPLGSSAIDFEFGNIYRPIVLEGCVGCGLCVEVCPEPSIPIRIVSAELGTVTKHKL